MDFLTSPAVLPVRRFQVDPVIRRWIRWMESWWDKSSFHWYQEVRENIDIGLNWEIYRVSFGIYGIYLIYWMNLPYPPENGWLGSTLRLAVGAPVKKNQGRAVELRVGNNYVSLNQTV